MLCQFSVKNFRSIKDLVTLDMQATNITEHINSLIDERDGEKFLPLAVFYGPNGGGKSTMLSAIHRLASLVMRPICAQGCEKSQECMKSYGDKKTEPFAFAKETAKAPTEFELFFRTDTNEYRYQLSTTPKKVMFESLWKRKIDGYRYSEVFTRKGVTTINLKTSFKKYQVEDLSANLPLLSFFGITHRRNAVVKDVIGWFEDKLTFADFTRPSVDYQVSIPKDDEHKKLVLEMLKEVDIDIADYRVERYEDGEIKKVYSQHIIDDKKYELDFMYESEGSQKLLTLLTRISLGLKNGETLISDELDAKLHPKLLEYIISLYSNPSSNKHGAQLIFTSHDLSTMNSDVFRRDEIWFVAKNNEQASKAYSLIEFKTEKGDKIRKNSPYGIQYFKGMYGADPYLQKIIDWEADQ